MEKKTKRRAAKYSRKAKKAEVKLLEGIAKATAEEAGATIAPNMPDTEMGEVEQAKEGPDRKQLGGGVRGRLYGGGF